MLSIQWFDCVLSQVLFMELRLPYERKKVTGKRGAPWSTAQSQLEKIKSLHPLPGMLSTTHNIVMM